MKNCKHCGAEFEQKIMRGHEQLYCSSSCQNKASRIRRENRLMELKNVNNEKMQIEKTIDTGRGIEQNDVGQGNFSASIRGVQEPTISNPMGARSFADNNAKNYLELYYEAKIDNNFYKLKNESLEKRVLQLEREVFDLNSELEKLEEGEDENGMLGNIMTEFKKDPINSMKFVNAVLDNFTTTKK